MLASKRAEVASTRVSRTLELEGVLNSFRSAMKGTARRTIYGITARRRDANLEPFFTAANGGIRRRRGPYIDGNRSRIRSAAEIQRSDFSSRLSLMHELGIKAAVPDGFVEIPAGLAVQGRQPAVRGNQSGEHAETGLECEHSALTMA